MTHEDTNADTDTNPTTGTDGPDGTGPRTLGEISHTHPHTGHPFGDTLSFERGRTVAADGGERDSRATRDADASDAPDGNPEGVDDSGASLREVDHTPPAESEGTNSVYERGHEGREEDR